MHYTQSQILCGIREVWKGLCLNGNEPLEPNTNIIDSIKASGEWDEIDLADVFAEVDRYFRIERPLSEWDDFFGYRQGQENFSEWETKFAPKLTFASLAQFIAPHLNYVSLAPAVVAGKLCGPAGAFYGIEKIASEIVPHPVRFAPSTKIRSVLSRESLDKLWRQLNWMTESGLPTLPDGHRMLGCLAVPVLILSAVAGYFSGEVLMFAMGAFIAMICFGVMQVCENVLDPLPLNMKTFGELAIHLSKQDCDATRADQG